MGRDRWRGSPATPVGRGARCAGISAPRGLPPSPGLAATWIARLRSRPGMAGDGWLRTESALPATPSRTIDLLPWFWNRLVALDDEAAASGRMWRLFTDQGDPNDRRLRASRVRGLRYMPLTTREHRRIGTRERAARRCLRISGPVCDRDRRAGHARAAGPGRHGHRCRIPQGRAAVSRARGRPAKRRAKRAVLRARGDSHPGRRHLQHAATADAVRHRRRRSCAKLGIRPLVDLAGVGANLQDRYEVGVVNRVRDDWGVLKGAKYKSTDPQYADWLRTKNELEGSVYGSNGAVLAAIRRSAPERPVPGSLLLRRTSPISAVITQAIPCRSSRSSTISHGPS